MAVQEPTPDYRLRELTLVDAVRYCIVFNAEKTHVCK